MKKIHIFFSLVIIAILSACGGGDGSEVSSQDNVVKIGAVADGYPQVYVEDDEVKGFSADVIEAIFEHIDYEVEWAVTDWTGVLASLETGKIDTVAGFAETPERAEKYNFTNPYYYSRVSFAVAEDNETIYTFDDMKGKQAANVTGSNYGSVLEEYDPNGEVEIVNFEAPDVIYQDVATGKIDAFVSGREMLLARVKDMDIPLRVIDDSFGEKLVSFPFAPNEENDQLIEELNQAIEDLREEGTLEEISNEWFGEDITKSAEEDN